MFRHRYFLLTLSVSFLSTCVFGQEPSSEQEDADKKLRDQLVAAYREHAASYKIVLGLEGAVFTLVSSSAGTDPEVMIVIEARQVDGQWKWHYAVCRFTDLKTWISLDKKVVWSFENGTDGPYIDSGINDPYRFSHEGTISVPSP